MATLDCRNQPCPAPVLAVKKALESNKMLTVLLDDGAPRENVSRFARNRGYSIKETENPDGWILTITPNGTNSAQQPVQNVQNETVLLVSSDSLGNGSEELGKLLMKNFITTLLESSDLPSKIFFLNSGVKLTCDGSDSIEPLAKLFGMGVEIFSCGLCLEYFSLKDKLRAGATTNMVTIVETVLTANKVVNLP